MEKVVLVKSYFAPIGKEVTVKVPTGEKKSGFFGGEKEVYRNEKRWEQTGYSDCIVDSKRLAADLQRAIDNLNRDGFSVKMITPVISGDYSYKYQAQGISSSKRILSETESVKGGASFGYGYGYSYTDSLLVIAEKNA
ncbi:TPA: hypothetical protein AB5H59_004042 [Vibrio mimicus]|uniref:hypothetical protein n=1 Tax=Vibrio mimicus TaxID=674 RepID=UPI000877F453|nr:hypothetical protein [Vibrio mimicus]AOW84091.1 hypothetical protein VM_15310 [Vibrio mimicus]TXY01878.1 hypothetical protein FXF05_11575 [Vibrio mimicus]